MALSSLIVFLIGVGASKQCKMPEDTLCIYDSGEYSFRSAFDEGREKHKLSIFKNDSVLLVYFYNRNIRVNYGKDGRFLIVDNQESNFSNCLVVDFPRRRLASIDSLFIAHGFQDCPDFIHKHIDFIKWKTESKAVISVSCWAGTGNAEIRKIQIINVSAMGARVTE